MDEWWRAPAAALKSSAAYRALAAGAPVADGLPLPAAAWVAEIRAAELGLPVLALVPHEADALAWLAAARLFGARAVYFSAPHLSPYQGTEVSLRVRAQETTALAAILGGEAATVVATPRALFRRLPPADRYRAATVELGRGGEVDLEELVERLVRAGYERSDLVGEVGELAVRGGVVDVFPAGEEAPVRLDLLGDTVESLRRFDPQDQRSREEIERVRLLPLSLFPAGPEDAARLAEQLSGEGAGVAGRELESLRRGRGFPGWENLLPAVAGATASLAELVGEAHRVAHEPPELEREIEAHASRLASDYEARSRRGGEVPPPEALELPAAAVRGLVRSAAWAAGIGLADRRGEAADFGGSVTDVFHGQLPRFPREVETARARGERLLVVTRREHRSRIESLCESYDLPLGAGGVEIVPGELERGFRLPPAGIAVYAEGQLFAPVAPARPRRRAAAAFSAGLQDLRVGDYVVHADHGIGQYVALRTVGGDGAPAAPRPPVMPVEARHAPVEVMEIVYAAGRRLLLPLERLDKVQKYGGIEGAAPRLDTLGGSSWRRTRDRVRRGMRELAADLLKLDAERHLSRAPALPPGSELQAQFEAAFDHQETADQLEAIAAIRRDLARERPMDRLLCGDVGFGKTEVAMRAAFQAVEGGSQVAVLAPTTILADQHLDTFSRRFTGFPVSVEMLSRFRSASEVRAIRRSLEAGQIDILIGTHRLLSRDIKPPRLGLLVIDEEQRFGVAQKERLKLLKKSVHVLSLSATPVPRTLQLALGGVRDLSVIETPPRDRLAVETAIVPFSPELVREAIEDEIERGGQVYYVYNRVGGIDRVADFLRRLVPGLEVTVGHGQMDEAELARRMHAFKRGEHQVLVATTIIENGIDISNVNTMLIHRADRFGLAQLYQLRGRVGRGNLLAYCYLMIPPDRALSETARRRLAAIRDFTELGAGFRIAARDLEIRGAGNLLGAEQSGHIAAVGIETYLKMLRDAVRELKGEAVSEPPSVSLDLPAEAAIPVDYVADANLRLELYRRIAAGDESEEEIVAELRDRFGPPPAPVLRLVEIAALKRLAESLHVQSIGLKDGDVQIRLRRDTPVAAEDLIRLVSERDDAAFSPSGVLSLGGAGVAGAVAAARRALEALAP